MGYRYETRYNSPNYSQGRPYGIESITVHHWGADGQTHSGVRDYLCRPGGNSSAHYIASDGLVSCIVDPDDRAWHAGAGLTTPHGGNATSIGIECRPECSPGDRETVAELIADLRETYGHLPLYPHRHWTATACPGRWEAHLDWLSQRADELLTARGTKPTRQEQTGGGLVVDGRAGTATITRAQTLAGTPVDGIVSGQWYGNRAHLPALYAVQWGTGGSLLVEAIQRAVGTTPDRYLGPATVTAMQRRLGVTPDSYLGPDTVTAWQHTLNNGRLI